MAFKGKIDWKYNDIPTERDINRIEQGVIDAHKMLEVNETQTLSFTPGTQVVESDIDTPITVDNVTGRTLINLLGRVGACDSFYGWHQHKEGGNPTFGLENGAIKLHTDVAGTSARIAYFIPAKTALKYGNKYLVAAKVKCSATGQAGIYCERSPLQQNKTTDWETMFSLVSAFGSADSYLVVGGATQANITTYVDNVRLYEVTETEYATLSQMTPEQIDKRYPYVDGMTNVTNPYAIVTGENLLPPFYHYDGATNGAVPTIESAYKALITTTATTNHFLGMTLNAQPNTTYTIKVDKATINTKMYVNEMVEHGIPHTKQHVFNPVDGGTFTTSTDTSIIGVYFGNSNVTGTFSVENPMLTLGSTPKPFQPQKRSMWAVDAELAANPVTGADADVLYTGDDGLPYVMEKWEKIKLDGRYAYNVEKLSYVGFKAIRIPDIIAGGSIKGDYDDDSKIFASKYDGKSLDVLDVPISGGWGTADLVRINASNLYISVSNADSGWGDKYEPTPDEVKAYFLGWTMYNGAAGNSPDVPASNLYNGTGTKWWVRRADGVGRDWRNATMEVPTALAEGWTPYRFQYLKTSPSVVPIANYETGAMLTSGANVVEIYSGVVIREKANPVNATGFGAYNINNFNPSSKLAHKTGKILSVTRNSVMDDNWVVESSNPIGDYGAELATIKDYNYDSTATYHATYTMLAPTLAATINAKVAANMRGTVSELVDHVGDVERRLSVVETQKADADRGGHIVPTTYNGWQLKGEGSHYRKEGDRVYVALQLVGGTKAKGTTLVRIPYKPAISAVVDHMGATFNTEQDIITIGILHDPDGSIKIGACDQGVSRNYISTEFSFITKD